MNNPQKAKEWKTKISKFKKSSMTKEAWCEKNNISLRQFNYWFKQLQSNSSTKNTITQWLPVEVAEEKITASPISIKIGSASVEVNSGFDKQLLSEILTILKTL